MKVQRGASARGLAQAGRSIEDRQRDLLHVQRVLTEAGRDCQAPPRPLSPEALEETAKLVPLLGGAEKAVESALAELKVAEAVYRAIDGMDDDARAELERQLRLALDPVHEAAH